MARSNRIKKILKARLKEVAGNRDEALELYDQGIFNANHIEAIDHHIEALKSPLP